MNTMNEINTNWTLIHRFKDNKSEINQVVSSADNCHSYHIEKESRPSLKRHICILL